MILPCHRWKEFGDSLASGEMLFRDLEKMLGSRDYDVMLAEIKLLDIEDNTAEKIISQLKQFRHLITSVKGATEILKFKRQYGLTGDFKPVMLIAQVKFDKSTTENLLCTFETF